MALCPTLPNPPAIITEGLKKFDTFGQVDDLEGDFTVAGVGTRNFGQGKIRLYNIPPGTNVVDAFLIYNTYQSNNIPNPVVKLNGNNVTSTLFGISGSTCWRNPPNELTTYLRNRVYIATVTPLVKGNGSYLVTGLPVDLTKPIGVDGDRIPGCRSSQGAILFVVWEWKAAFGPKKEELRLRAINVYLGSKLITAQPQIWGGSRTYNLPFEPVFNNTIEKFYKGNANISAVAGDTQNTILGDSFAINQIRFVPPYNCWLKNGGPSLSIKKIGFSSIYDGVNSAYATTFNDCINWFFFAISGDKTEPKAQFQIVNCAATALLGRAFKNEDGDLVEEAKDVQPADTMIIVYSNYVKDNQTAKTVSSLNLPTGNLNTLIQVKLPLLSPIPQTMPFRIRIGTEYMDVTATNGADWTVTRGVDGTLPQSHSKGDRVAVWGHCLAIPFNPPKDPTTGKKLNPAPPNTPGMFPNAPYYISIDNEIMRVVGKQQSPSIGNDDAPIDDDGQRYPDPIVWTVERGSSGTTPAVHKVEACVYLLAPPKFIANMQSALAGRGQPRGRPSPGRPSGRRGNPKGRKHP